MTKALKTISDVTDMPNFKCSVLYQGYFITPITNNIGLSGTYSALLLIGCACYSP